MSPRKPRPCTVDGCHRHALEGSRTVRCLVHLQLGVPPSRPPLQAVPAKPERCTWQRPDGRRCTQPYDHPQPCTFLPGQTPADEPRPTQEAPCHVHGISRCTICLAPYVQAVGTDDQPCPPVDGLQLGRQLRDKGMAQVTAASDDADRAAIDQAIARAAATGLTFSANDVRQLLPPGIRAPLVGARFMAASRRGDIVKVGFTPSTDPGTHAHPVAIWRRA